MKGLTLSTKEQNRLQILNGVLERYWTIAEVAPLLGVSERQGWRMLSAHRSWTRQSSEQRPGGIFGKLCGNRSYNHPQLKLRPKSSTTETKHWVILFSFLEELAKPLRLGGVGVVGLSPLKLNNLAEKVQFPANSHLNLCRSLQNQVLLEAKFSQLFVVGLQFCQ